MRFAMAIHGGAGTLPRHEMTPDREREYRDGLAGALQTGVTLLARGASSLDAVTAAAVLLEDNPLFNAGRGAVFSHEGINELDAAIMDGATLNAGAVAALKHIKNPVQLARAVMERSAHVMLIGAGAEEFARAQGFSLVPREYFATEERRQQLRRIQQGDARLSPLTISHVGTVGAVALDAAGNLAAATSTGGMTDKRHGRIGDTPIIGAGTYADNRSCAVSATGHGEMFIRAAAAHDICARMRYGGEKLAAAVGAVVQGELKRLKGEGGVIAVDRAGNVVMDFNCEGMFRACQYSDGRTEIAIYR
jgi:L-asparaginase / beta-aspartyl-peptidase